MTESKPGRDESEDSHGDQEIGHAAKKKPYRKPEFRDEAVFDSPHLRQSPNYKHLQTFR
jgi:hypothetical protein